MSPEAEDRSKVTQGIVWFRIHAKPIFKAHRWTILLILGVITFLLGIIGFSIYYANHPQSIPNLVYASLQLFLLRSGFLDLPSNPLLDIARFVAPVLAFVSLILIITDSVYQDAQLIWHKFVGKDHIIVCGLGYIGPIIARHCHSRGENVIVIEKDPKHPEIEKIKNLGILVITGDATDTRTLQRAKVETAQALFAVTGTDEVNAKVVLKVNEILSSVARTRITCYVHIVDPAFANLLRGVQGTVRDQTGIKLEFFNIYQAASNCILDCMKDLPPLRQSPPDLHVLIVGLGKMGESLLIQLAKRWRELYGQDPEKELIVSVLDKHATKKAASLELRYRNLSDCCRITGYKMDLAVDPAFYAASYLEDPETHHRVDAIIVCTPNEPLNFSVGLYLNEQLHGEVPIIIRTVHSKGFAQIFNRICTSTTDEFRNFHVFPLVSCSCCLESLIDGFNERIARAMHDIYVIDNLRSGQREATDVAMQPWHLLDEEYRESNRDQAANMRRTLEKHEYTIVSQTDWSEPPLQFPPGTLEELAEAEHDRWVNERTLRGWKYGPERNLERKESPYLVPWEQLDEATKDYDRAFVRSYPVILSLIDLKIVPIAECVPGESGHDPDSPWMCD